MNSPKATFAFHCKGGFLSFENPTVSTIAIAISSWPIERITVATQYATWILNYREVSVEGEGAWLELLDYQGKSRQFAWDRAEEVAAYLINVPPPTQEEIDRATLIVHAYN